MKSTMKETVFESIFQLALQLRRMILFVNGIDFFVHLNTAISKITQSSVNVIDEGIEYGEKNIHFLRCFRDVCLDCERAHEWKKDGSIKGFFLGG